MVERLFISMATLHISVPNQSFHGSAVFASLQTGNVYIEMGLLVCPVIWTVCFSFSDFFDAVEERSPQESGERKTVGCWGGGWRREPCGPFPTS